MLVSLLLFSRRIRRQRIKVTLDGEPLPKLVLNEAFIGELDPSQ